MTQEHKDKIRAAHIGLKHKPMSEQGRKNISDALKGRKIPLEVRKKIADAHRGEKNWKWSGGVKRGKHACAEYRQWRSDIFQRDDWTCRTCLARGVYLEAHHIKSWAKYPELRFAMDNGITLCRECHKLTDNYKGRNI